MMAAAANGMSLAASSYDEWRGMNTQWWRRRREAVGRPRREAAGDDTLLTLVLSLVVGALLTATIGFWALAKLEQLGPSVGAVIVFKPGTQSSDWWQIAAERGDSTHFNRLDSFGGRKCVLNPGTMTAGGGSIIIEARRLSLPPVYRVHWAGSRTSRGVSDCGANVDLILSRAELMKLANAAGGFNNGFGLIGP